MLMGGGGGGGPGEYRIYTLTLDSRRRVFFFFNMYVWPTGFRSVDSTGGP